MIHRTSCIALAFALLVVTQTSRATLFYYDCYMSGAPPMVRRELDLGV